MKQITLSKQQVHLLAYQIENHPDGYTVPEMEQVQRVSKVLTAATGDYRAQLIALEKEFKAAKRRILREHKDKPEAGRPLVAALIDETNELMAEVIEAEGAEAAAPILLEDADFAFALKQWEPDGKRVGNLQFQQNCLVIQRTLKEAIEVSLAEAQAKQAASQANGRKAKEPIPLAGRHAPVPAS